MLITPEDFEVGIGFLSEMEKTLHMVFGGTGRNDLVRVANKILAFIKAQQEPVSLAKIKVTFWSQFRADKASEELASCLEQLCSEGAIIKADLITSNLAMQIYADSVSKINSLLIKSGRPPLPDASESTPDVQPPSGP